MLKIPNKGFKRIYVYGGSGILDSIASVFSKGIVKRAASEAAKRATQLVEKAATETGKKLGEKAVQKITSKSRDILKKHLMPSPTTLTSKSKDILEKFTRPKEDFNLNALIDGSGAIRIQDYVRSSTSASR